jgi:hypothetical protein
MGEVKAGTVAIQRSGDFVGTRLLLVVTAGHWMMPRFHRQVKRRNAEQLFIFWGMLKPESPGGIQTNEITVNASTSPGRPIPIRTALGIVLAGLGASRRRGPTFGPMVFRVPPAGVDPTKPD